MAEPHSLKAGDKVKHAEWPEGTVRTCTGAFMLGTRGRYEKGRYSVKKIADERYMQLDEPVAPVGEPDYADDYWAEIGLELVEE